MAIPTEKAYETLNLPLGASKDAIEQSYKKLAFKWHPEKYTTTKNTQEALKVGLDSVLNFEYYSNATPKNEKCLLCESAFSIRFTSRHGVAKTLVELHFISIE